MAGDARILIVDDEPFNVDLLEQELELLGYTTVSAADGREALARLGAEPVDLVLLDVMMRELDGYQVLERMKQDAQLRHVPVIMISALDQLASTVRCIELGAEDFLPKPFDPVLLKARIGACLEKKHWHDREVAYRCALERERERADRLLHAILPAPAVAELKASDRVTPRRYERVTVLFADIVDFTVYSEAHAAEEVVANLDCLIETGEKLVSEHGLEKIKTIGDGLVATANLLQRHADPVFASVRCRVGDRRGGADQPRRLEDPGRHPRRARGRGRGRTRQVQLRPLGRYSERRGSTIDPRLECRGLSERRRLGAGGRALSRRAARARRRQRQGRDRGASLYGDSSKRCILKIEHFQLAWASKSRPRAPGAIGHDKVHCSRVTKHSRTNGGAMIRTSWCSRSMLDHSRSEPYVPASSSPISHASASAYGVDRGWHRDRTSCRGERGRISGRGAPRR